MCGEVRQRWVRLGGVVKPPEDPHGQNEVAEQRSNRLVLPEELDKKICMSGRMQRPRGRTFQAIVSVMDIMIA